MAWDSAYESIPLRALSPKARTKFQALGGSARVTFTGVHEIMRRLSRDIPEATQASIAGVVNSAALVVLQKADEFVPVDTGALHGTGQIIPMTPTSSRSISSTQYRVAIQYGSPEVPYAVYVHENVGAAHGAVLNMFHDYKKSNTRPYESLYRTMLMKRPWHPRRAEEQAKFMDRAFMETQVEVQAILAAGLRTAIMRILKNPKRFGYSGAHDPALGGYAEMRKEFDYGS